CSDEVLAAGQICPGQVGECPIVGCSRTDHNSSDDHRLSFRKLASHDAHRETSVNPPIYVRNKLCSANRRGVQIIMNSRILLLSILLMCGFASTVLTQETLGSEDATITLRQQLIDLEDRETQLRARLEEVDEQLKPENIAWAVAGIGSTRPEELREHR